MARDFTPLNLKVLPETLPTAPRTIPVPKELEAKREPPWQIVIGSSWLLGYRIIEPGAYKVVGLIGQYQLHLKFYKFIRGALIIHLHAYLVTRQVTRSFLGSQSKGKFVHKILLGPGWNNQNRKCRYTNWPL